MSLQDYLVVQDNQPVWYLLTSTKMDDAPQLRRNPIVRVSRFVGSVFHDSKMAKLMIKHRRSRGSSRTKLVRTPTCWPLGKGSSKKFYWVFLGWEKVPHWECLFVHRKQRLFLSVYVDDIKMSGRKHNMAPMLKILMKLVDLGEPTSFL